MTLRVRTGFDNEALSDGKAGKMRTKESGSLRDAQELVKAGLEPKQQTSKTADRDGAEPFYVDHI